MVRRITDKSKQTTARITPRTIKKRKITAITLIVAIILSMTATSGCDALNSTGKQSGNEDMAENAVHGSDDGKLSIVCTIFPQYDWVRRILGEKADKIEINLLAKSRIDFHSYQPTVSDILTISTCDLFIYVGGQSDNWVEDALKEATNEDMLVISLLRELGGAAKEEEIAEGMTEAEEEEAGDGIEYDEHVWLSVRNAILFCPVITEALSSLDADNAGEYRNNLDEYVKELARLDSDYRTAVDNAAQKVLLFGDRFAFRYMATITASIITPRFRDVLPKQKPALRR